MLRKVAIIKVILTIVGAVIISLIISFITERVNVLERFTIAINDLDFTDIYYQYRPKPKADENIIIVNIGNRNRSEIAKLLKVISANNPKVIGCDIFFTQEFDTIDNAGTKLLSTALSAINNVVLASAYTGKTFDDSGTIAIQSSLIRKHVKEGIVHLNIATDDPEYGTVRSFKPVTNINEKEYLSFGFLVASFLDSTVLQYADEDEMMIRWYGSGDIFQTIDADQITNGEFDQRDLAGKIVLLGFLGESVGDYVPGDIFYTPLNKKIIGRSLPDMYGVEVHANIIKMIVDKEFIYHSSATDFLFNAVFLTVFTLLLFWIQSRYTKQYAILSKIALIIFVDLFILAVIGLFSATNGNVKFLIADGLFVMLFLPDTYEFLVSNVFSKFKYGQASAREIA